MGVALEGGKFDAVVVVDILSLIVDVRWLSWGVDEIEFCTDGNVDDNFAELATTKGGGSWGRRCCCRKCWFDDDDKSSLIVSLYLFTIDLLLHRLI